MNKKEQWITILVIAASIVLGWFFRYDLQVIAAGGQGVAGTGYMLNRWTGTAYFLAPTFVRELRQDAPTPTLVPLDLGKKD